MKKGRLIIIAAPSGAGKTSVIKRFLSTHPNTVHSISCTTRPIRPGKVDEGYYQFLDHKTFKEWMDRGEFAEWAEVHGHLYGTPKEPLEKSLDEGGDVLLDLDVVGSLKLKELYGERAVSIFILPPSVEELTKRLSARGTDSLEVRRIRLRNAIEEMKFKDNFDYQVINDNLEHACLEIERIIT